MSAPKFRSLQIGGLVMGERKEYTDYRYGTKFPSFTTLWLIVSKQETPTLYGTNYTFHLLKIYNSRKLLPMESAQVCFLEIATTTITDVHFSIAGTKECVCWSIV